jgi:3-hydroxyacyl-[acyl-carrier-protein] dehydratase
MAIVHHAKRSAAVDERPPSSPLVAGVELQRASGDEAVTTIAIAHDEPVLAGHYPGFPILPGVCLLDCAHRTVLAWARRQGHRLELDVVESTRFLNPVFPGDTVTTEVRIERAGDHWRCRASVSTERSRAADVRLRYREVPMT